MMPDKKQMRGATMDPNARGEETAAWRGLAVSVQGAHHLRAQRPNQDASLVWPPTGFGPTLVLAVADGHGGPAYTRSHVGACCAVRTAVRLLGRELLDQVPGETDQDLVRVRQLCREHLPPILVRQWRDRMERYTRLHPFPEEEGGGPAPSATGNEPALLPYGATLLAALLTPRFHLYLQLGDGDILVVDREGAVRRPPRAADPRLLANETTSLCNKEAWRNMDIHFQPILDAPPALVLLATDGYANSFAEEEGFRQVAEDLLQMLTAPNGPETVQRELPAWLAATSAAGSGDDISVALAWRTTPEGAPP